jgi:hypothetical protein
MAEESESKAKSKAAGEGARSTSAQRSYSSEDIDAGAGGTRDVGHPRVIGCWRTADSSCLALLARRNQQSSRRDG